MFNDNLGQVDNNGIELSLNSTNIDKGDFRWTSAFTFSHNKNTIKHLFYDYVTDANGNVTEKNDTGNKWFISHSIDQIWDYKVDGIWQESECEEAKNYSRAPGDFKLMDVDGDGVYTNDRQAIPGQYGATISG